MIRKTRMYMPVIPGMLWCSDCQDYRPEDIFPNEQNRGSGKSAYCQPCKTARTTLRYQKAKAEREFDKQFSII